MEADLNNFYKKFSKGEIVVVFDEHREEEGDFFILAENITPEKVNFFLTYGKGMICVSCAPQILENLKIPKMTEFNECPHSTNYALPVDAAENITTGVSAYDRCEVIKVLANPSSDHKNLIRPGHTTPLIAQDPRKRFGHTEAAVELAKKCDKFPVVVICEILNNEGQKASKAELLELANKFDLVMADLESLKKDLIT